MSELSEEPTPSTEQSILRYDRGTLFAEFILAVPCSLFLLWLLWRSHAAQSPIVYLGFGLAVGGAWIHAFFVWRSPSRIVIDDSSITACWRGGMCKSWKTREVWYRRPATWLTRALGAVEVVNSAGEVQFRVWKEILGFGKLLEVIREEQ